MQNRFQGKNLQFHPVVGEGLAGNKIVSAIDQFGIDLAVVGHLGLSGIRRFLLGSVSEWVLTHAACSVLMVRNLLVWTRPKRPRGMIALLAVDYSTDEISKRNFEKFFKNKSVYHFQCHDHMTPHQWSGKNQMIQKNSWSCHTQKP